MTWPVNDIFANAITSMTGTVDAQLSGAKRVEVRITTDPVTGPDWNGAGYTFTGVPIYSTATITGGLWAFPGSRVDPNGLVGAFIDGRVYFLYVKATDNADQDQLTPAVFKVSYDAGLPSAGISFPNSPPAQPAYSNNGESTRLSTYTWGSVSDFGGAAGSGIRQVWVAISGGSPIDSWWDDVSRTFVADTGTILWSTEVYKAGGVWNYSAPQLGGLLLDNKPYKVYAKALDKAGNWINNVTNPALSTIVQPFKYDVTRPTSTVATPVNGSEVNAGQVNSATFFSGSSLETGAGLSGVYTVYMAIRHVEGAAGSRAIGWWDWTLQDFNASIPLDPGSPLPVASPNPWTQVSSTTLQNLSSLAWSTPVVAGLTPGMLQSSGTYRVIVAAIDQATNQQVNPALLGAGSIFHYDTQAPTAAFTSPPYNAYRNLASLGTRAGTANDETTGAAGLQSVQVLLKAQDAEAYWDGSNLGTFGDDWDTTAGTKYLNWQTVTGLGNWTKSFPSLTPVDSRQFRLWIRATDKAGNSSATPTDTMLDNDQQADGATLAYRFIYDNTPPITRVTAPPVYSSIFPATVSGTAADAYPSLNPSGVNDVRLKLQSSDVLLPYWDLFNQIWVAADPGFSTSAAAA